MNKINGRGCLECGTLFQGRADKKFCSDQCRASHHARASSQSREYIRLVNNILKKNHQILSDLVLAGHRQVPVETLRLKGYNFSYFTSVSASDKGVHYYCYEHGITTAPGDGRLSVLTREVLP